MAMRTYLRLMLETISELVDDLRADKSVMPYVQDL